MHDPDQFVTVFACGFSGSRDEKYLRPLMDSLQQSGSETICCELPNQDLRQRVLRSTLTDAVENVVESANKSPSSRLILAGQSLGGTIALLAAARLVERGLAGRLEGIVCFSPILNPRTWFSPLNYEFFDDPDKAPRDDSLLRIRRRSRESLVARRFWQSMQHNPIEDSDEWLDTLAAAEVPAVIFLGLDDRQWTDAMVARIRTRLQSCDVRIESRSRHHFQGSAGTRVAHSTREWLVQRFARPVSPGLPAAVAFDWDGVLSFAKCQMDHAQVLRRALRTVAACPGSAWYSRVDVDQAWSALRHEVPSTGHGGHWRAMTFRLAEMTFPAAPELRTRATIELGAEYLDQHLQSLRDLHRAQDAANISDWCVEMFQELARRGIRLALASHAIQEEVLEEATLAGLSHAFARIYGYPVRKEDALRALSHELGAPRDRIVLVDDMVDSVRGVASHGFRAVLLADAEAAHELGPVDSVRIVTPRHDNDELAAALKDAILAGPRGTTEVSADAMARRFLGNGMVTGRVLTRFGTEPIWRVWHPDSDERYYLKTMHMPGSVADATAKLLLDARGEGVPVATWMPVCEKYSIEIGSQRCVVLETALTGRAVTYDDLETAHIEEAARSLAHIHEVMERCVPSAESFRRGFPAGLDAFGGICDEFWRLLVYASHRSRQQQNPTAPGDELRNWLVEQGERILLRFERTRDELREVLRTTRQQLILGDFNCSNVLFDRGTVCGIIDYEDIHFGPRELDVLTHCMFGETQLHPPANAETFVNAYLERSPGHINHRALGIIARAIAHARLYRMLRRDLVLAYTAGEVSMEALGDLNYMNQLCINLENWGAGGDTSKT